jgi:hypothetical protein
LTAVVLGRRNNGRGAHGGGVRYRPTAVHHPDRYFLLISGINLKWLAPTAREGRFDYVLEESTGIAEPLPVAGPRLGRRTALTFPLLPPPQKN